MTTTMNTLKQKMSGNWHMIKGKLKEKYGQLTDDDLSYVEGKEEEILGKIQKRTGQAREEIIDTIDTLSA